MIWRLLFILLGIIWLNQSWANVSLILDQEPVISINMAIPTARADSARTDSAQIQSPLYWNQQAFDIEAYTDSLKPNPDVYWYKLQLTTSWPKNQKQTRYIVLESYILRHATFYLLQDNQIITQAALGLNDSDTLMNTDHGLTFKGSFFKFELSGESTYTLLIRKQNDGPGLLPLTIYDEPSFENYINTRNLFWGGIMAVLVVMALYNLIVYTLHPSKAYLWYLAFHSTCFFYFSGLNGFGYLLWPFSLQSWLAQNIMPMNFLLVFLIMQFARQFLEAYTYAQWHEKFVWPLSIVALVGMCVSLFVKEYDMIPFFSVIQLMGTIYGISMGWVAYKNGLSAAKFFLISWLFTLTGGAVGMATAVGQMPVNFITLHGFLFGTLCELFLFSVALAYRIKDIEDHFLARSFYYPDTNIANFSYLKNKLPEHLPALHKRHHQIAIFIFDIQGYRELVSLYGPDALTKTYRIQTDRITEYIRQQPWAISMPLPTGELTYIAALPGEQVFMMMDIENDPDLTHVSEIMKALFKQSEVIQDGGQGNVQIQLHAGISFLTPDKSLTRAFREAQVALLTSLEKRTSYLIYETHQDESISHRTELVLDLNTAIKKQALNLYIQPQYSLKTNQVVGGEILLRWTHPLKGAIGPSIFIPLAEKSGLIFPITKFVIEQSCSWLKLMKEQYPSFYKDFQLSVNISAMDIAEPQFIPFLQSTLFYYGIDNSKIMLEVTESAVLDNSDLFISTIQKLHTLGFPISIDDFGTGYSSMQYLQTLKADEIKIDMAFVRDIHRNQINHDISRAITQLARATEAKTVAEGIECADEVETLKHLNCDHGQGFYWSKPLPLSDFIEHFLS